MKFENKYKSKTPDKNGYIEYTDVENDTWRRLYERQSKIIQDRACDDFIKGVEVLKFNEKGIPQLNDVNEALGKATGWAVEPVAALISSQKFFTLLKNKKFPVATFIRVPEELDYIKEPDIFHEFYGHCPLITDPVYAEFLQAYGEMVLGFPEQDWPLLQRFFWFTVEFGLIQTSQGLRAYGGGILSSIGETPYSLESHEPLRILFDPVAVFRMPYRIDKMQVTYFVIDSYKQLYNILQEDITGYLEEARALGEFEPQFEVEHNAPGMNIDFC